MPAKKIIDEYKARMAKTVEVLHEGLKTVRTGRASTALVDSIMVDYYGTPTALKQIATIAAPQPDMLVIKPFDPGSAKDIEKAIKNSDLSISPIMDGKVIRLNVPPLSQERRSQLVAQAKHTGEQAKVGIRNIRREANKHLEKEQKDKIITEDDLDKGKKQIDEIVRESIDKIESLVKNKANEIMLD